MARITLPVTDISRIITSPPALTTATGAEGLKFANASGDVILEIISSTISQSLTIETGLVIESEWAVADTLANISNANTTYYLGPFPQNIYNQDTVDNLVYIDHAVNAVLQFRAWRIT
jgi:hypothetical protein